MSSRDSATIPRRKKVTLSVQQKLEVIRKLEAGTSVAKICDEYGIKKQTVSDIRKAKDKLSAFSVKYNVDPGSKASSVSGRKRMRVAKDSNLEEAVTKWFIQQRSCGTSVRGVEIQAAAAKLARHMGIENFEASGGWLWRYRNRHGLGDKLSHGEAGSAPIEAVEPYRKKLNDLIKNEKLLLSQLYNGDETGLFWRSLPRNTQAFKHEGASPGRKLSKDRFSVLCCANADGLHRLQLVVVGRYGRPRALKDCMNHLPVLYYNSQKAWFTMAIFKDWFYKHFIPSVRKHQEEVLKLPADEVKALLILDNAPAHPCEEQLVSEDGRIRCMFLPPNVTSLIQPMDQGVIVACKRLYQRRYIDEVLVVLEDDEDLVHDTRGKRTLDNIKKYNIKSAIFNVAAAWNAVKITTLANAWKKLLYDTEVDLDFEGFEARDFHHALRRAGEEVSEDDVRTWLEDTEGDPGYHVMTEEEIADDVLAGDNRDESSDENEDDEPLPTKPKLSVVRDSLDNIISYIDLSPESEIQQYYQHFRAFREIIIKKQYQPGKQLKLDSFFKPARPNVAEADTDDIDDPRPQSPQPSTSGYQPPASSVQSMEHYSSSDSE